MHLHDGGLVGIIRAGFTCSATLAHVRCPILARADCGVMLDIGSNNHGSEVERSSEKRPNPPLHGLCRPPVAITQPYPTHCRRGRRRPCGRNPAPPVLSSPASPGGRTSLALKFRKTTRHRGQTFLGSGGRMAKTVTVQSDFSGRQRPILREIFGLLSRKKQIFGLLCSTDENLLFPVVKCPILREHPVFWSTNHTGLAGHHTVDGMVLGGGPYRFRAAFS